MLYKDSVVVLLFVFLRDTSVTVNMSSLHLQIAIFFKIKMKLYQSKKSNEIEFHDIKPVYFEDAQVDHCYAPFEVTVEK